MLGLEEQGVLAVQDRLLQSAFADVVVQRRTGHAEEQRQLLPVLAEIVDRRPQPGVRLHQLLFAVTLEPLAEAIHRRAAVLLMELEPLLGGHLSFAGADGVVELTPFEFLNRLADLVPPPRKHRHRYHGVFAPNHKLRRAVTAMAVGNVGKQREATAAGYASDDHATGGCCDANHVTLKPRSHDTSRIAWAKLVARVGQEFPLECPNCSGDIRLIAFITEPGPIRKILTHLGEPLDPPPVSPARGPPTDWGELVQADEDREAVQGSPDELPVIDIHSL